MPSPSEQGPLYQLVGSIEFGTTKKRIRTVEYQGGLNYCTSAKRIDLLLQKCPRKIEPHSGDYSLPTRSE